MLRVIDGKKQAKISFKNTEELMRKVNNFKEYNILLGKRLREIRIEMKLSQKDIGNILDVSFQQVQKYESGQNRLSCASAAVLCEELGINIQDIVTKPVSVQNVHLTHMRLL